MWNEASVAHSTDGLRNASLVDFLYFRIPLPYSFILGFLHLPNKLFVLNHSQGLLLVGPKLRQGQKGQRYSRRIRYLAWVIFPENWGSRAGVYLGGGEEGYSELC